MKSHTMYHTPCITYIPLMLFDYATLCRLGIVNKEMYQKTRDLRSTMNRTQEIQKYLQSKQQTNDEKRAIIFSKLSQQEVWTIFQNIKAKSEANSYRRYVYVPTTLTGLNIHCLTSSGYGGIMLNSSSFIKVDSLLNYFGDTLLCETRELMINTLWITLNILAKNIEHSHFELLTVHTWMCFDIYVLKIDTWSQRIYMSDKFFLATEKTFADIPTYYPTKVSLEQIRNIVYGLVI